MRWEYLSVKLHEFGAEEAELKRHNEYWVSEYGLLPLMNSLGEDGWEAICQVGRDLIMRRIYDGPARKSRSAIVEMPEFAAKA
jgi:hypothetical protein